MLSDIWLASNWDASTGWAELTGRHYDIAIARYGESDWSVACNQEAIDRGSIGWIFRADGSWGHLAGVLAITGPPEDAAEARGTVSYAPGVLFPFPREWWVDGGRLNLSGWGAGAPFGRGPAGRRMARLRNGQRVQDKHLEIMMSLLHPVAREWVDRHRSL